MASVGDRIRERRKQLGWTQDVLVRKAGISKGFLSNLENSKRSVGAETLYDLFRGHADAPPARAPVTPCMIHILTRRVKAWSFFADFPPAVVADVALHRAAPEDERQAEEEKGHDGE